MKKPHIAKKKRDSQEQINAPGSLFSCGDFYRLWLHGEALTVEYEETPLAQYTVRYQSDKKHFKAIPQAKRFEPPYRSPQGLLWELDETMWQLAKRLPGLL